MTDSTLAAAYAGFIVDLDGVVYRGPTAVPGAVAALRPLLDRVIFATNNASRPAEVVAEHLTGLGLEVGPDRVATSSEAGAGVLAHRLPPGSQILAVGGVGVSRALADAGLRPVLPGDGTPVAAVLQGYGPQVTAADLAEAAYAIQGGALWVATNTDLTLPTDRGTAPGNGSLVHAVRLAVGRDPDVVAGKPFADLYRLCAQRLGAEPSRLLAIGDRIDTDIAGAIAAGTDSLLVLTGVSTREDLAASGLAATYVAEDLSVLGSSPSVTG